MANITPSANQSIGAPTALSAKALPTNTPPFPLNHARILYDNLLVGSTVGSSNVTNPQFTLIPNTAQRATFANVPIEITFTIPSAGIDTVCIGAHNLKGATLNISTSPNGVAPFTTINGSITVETNDAIMVHSNTLINAQAVRVSVTPVQAGFIGSVYAGVALQMMRPFYSGHSPSVLSRRTEFFSSDTESGNFIGVDVRRRALETSADWKNLTDPWYRQYFVPFLDSAETLPFYFAWNLLEHPNDVAYCKNITNISPTYQGQLDLMSVGIPIVGIA